MKKEREFYRGEDWDEQRKKCLARDKHRCRKCKKFTNKAHHICPWHQSHNNALSNLVSLCDRHHKVADNEFLRVGRTHYLEKLILENARMEVNTLKADILTIKDK